MLTRCPAPTSGLTVTRNVPVRWTTPSTVVLDVTVAAGALTSGRTTTGTAAELNTCRSPAPPPTSTARRTTTGSTPAGGFVARVARSTCTSSSLTTSTSVGDSSTEPTAYIVDSAASPRPTRNSVLLRWTGAWLSPPAVTEPSTGAATSAEAEDTDRVGSDGRPPRTGSMSTTVATYGAVIR